MHLLNERTAEEDDEFYGPMDGIMPTTEYYVPLQRSACIIGTTFINPQLLSAVCTLCYYANAQYMTGFHMVHEHSLHLPIIDLDPKCDLCETRHLIIRKATECQNCIEEYLFSKERVMAGEIIAVQARWLNSKSCSREIPERHQ